jgi:hypothetical protein
MKEKFKKQLDASKHHTCNHCRCSKAVKLRRNITKSNHSQFYWYCTDCQRKATSMEVYFIPHEVIRYWIANGLLPDMESIPIINDYRGEPCIICGETGVQFHHFAPQAFRELFGEEWIRWPGAYLCDEHHRQWHSVVTFYLPGPGAAHPEMLERYGAKTNVPSD